jgi:methyltransferase (TIGR00027 family)
MKSLNSSNLTYVAELRHIQSMHEPARLRNPDMLVGQFLPARRRWSLARVSQKKLTALRSDPFYYYLLARTKYYDQIFLDAISRNVQCIINVGCGSDTRSYRFENLLREKGIRVFECDQLEAISNKQKVAARRGRFDHISYLAIDLNQSTWPNFEHFLQTLRVQSALIMMEGVSPYVDVGAFTQFLKFLARTLPDESRVAYDYKLQGINDAFGRVGKTVTPFRLPAVVEEVSAYHKELGYRLRHMDLSAELMRRLLPGMLGAEVPLFKEDGLVQLEVISGHNDSSSRFIEHGRN